MKIFYSSAFLILAISIVTGCGGKGPAKKEAAAAADSTTVSDTGYTVLKNI